MKPRIEFYLPQIEKSRVDRWLALQANLSVWWWIFSWMDSDLFTLNFYGDCEEIATMFKLTFPEARSNV